MEARGVKLPRRSRNHLNGRDGREICDSTNKISHMALKNTTAGPACLSEAGKDEGKRPSAEVRGESGSHGFRLIPPHPQAPEVSLEPKTKKPESCPSPPPLQAGLLRGALYEVIEGESLLCASWVPGALQQPCKPRKGGNRTKDMHRLTPLGSGTARTLIWVSWLLPV